jgi:hypothetical protein
MSRADDIQNEQSKLKRELETIQDHCIHKKQYIKFNNDNKSYMWRCVKCSKDVRYPTTNELDKFIHS